MLASTDLKNWSVLATLVDTNANGLMPFLDPNSAYFNHRFYRARSLCSSTNTPTRSISLTGNLAFGNVTVGTTAQSTLAIANIGNTTLTVSGISYPAGFSGAWSGTIPAGGSQNVTVTFAPTNAASYSGTITVSSDATSGSLAVSGTGVSANMQGTVTFFDGTFDNANWSITTLGNGSASGSQQTSGGNPGFWWEVDNTMSDAGNFGSLCLFSPAVYNPQVSGAIFSIDFSVDARIIQDGAQATGVLLKQNGNFWRSELTTTPASVWTTYSATGLQATNFFVPWSFETPSLTPDFSTNGAPIEFGLFARNYNDAGITTSGGYDNFSVTIHQATPTGILSLSGDLAFGNVTVRTTAQSTLTLANNGNATLTISGISDPAGFSSAWSGTIPAGGLQNVTVTFTPTAVTNYGGTITVSSDASGGNSTIAVSGAGTSPTRLSWQAQQVSGIVEGTAIAYGNGGFVGVDSRLSVYNSANATNWTPNGSLAGYYSNLTLFERVRFLGGRFLLPAQLTNSSNEILESGDGDQWVRHSTGDYTFPTDTAYGNGVFVAVGLASVMVSADSTNWTAGQLSSFPDLSGVTFGNNRFVGVGQGYDASFNTYMQIVTSADGTNWVDVSPAVTNTLSDVTYGSGLFVAVGDTGTIMTSSNGTNWTAQASTVSANLNAVTYADGLFVAVGASGAILTSPDGVHWMPNDSGTTEALNSVTFANKTFYAVGSLGTVAQAAAP